MYIWELFKVLHLLILLINVCQGEEPDPKDRPCDITIDSFNTLTFNCSRREIETIPTEWPIELQEADEDGHVLVTFFNNKIKNVTQLPLVPGSRVAVSFKSNNIEEIVSDAFSNNKNLIYLDFSNNSITAQVLRSEIFQGPYNAGIYENIALETLNLGYNKIHSIDIYLFQYTPNLTRLYLNNNPIEILDHVTILALSSAQRLEVLDLAYTDIDHIPIDAFKSLINLKEIDLSGNRFSVVPESLRLVGTTLEYLTINNNPIVDLNDDSFIGLSNLKELEVAENPDLEEVKRSTFTPLTSLRVLHLCHNPSLRYISHNAFRNLKNRWTLKELYLDDNNLSELPTDLLPWDKLDVLGMTQNEWLCNCDLANIVVKQGAGEKFKPGETPYCVAPMKLSGTFITDMSLENCPTLDNTFSTKNTTFSKFRPKHILLSIIGVAAIVLIGMAIGLLINYMRQYYKNNLQNQSIRYININQSASSFA